MKTQFSQEQLADPAVARSEQVIRTCVHCGFCNATCPTYILTGDELEGPRGRIYLMKEMLENGRAASPTLVRHIDSCLSCLACMTTCPSGVHYMHLVDHSRAHIEETYRRPWFDRFLRWALAQTLPYPKRFRLALLAGKVGLLFRRFLPGQLGAMLDLLPHTLPAPAATSVPTPSEPTARVALLEGCVQQVLGDRINQATVRLLNRCGVAVVTPSDAGCCGALTLHLGREHDALAAAKKNIDAWTHEIETTGLDAIVINASGCGVAVKDYAHLLANDPDYAEKAARISAMTKDITEFLAKLDVPLSKVGGDRSLAYHAACSLQHGQGLTGHAQALLDRAGFAVRAVPEGHLCCGSAGTYNILHPENATALRDRKAKNIGDIQPAIVATGNIGCIAQLQPALGVPIVHTVELLDWAAGGPEPAGL